LRDRLDDLPLLLDHFLIKAARALNKIKPTVPMELAVLLQSYTFPGNVRELEAMVFDAVTRHKSGVMSLETFKKHMDREHPGSPDARTVNFSAPDSVRFPSRLPTIRQATRMLIQEAMQRAQGNQTVAARLLGISQQALSKRLQKSGKRQMP
jgi:DNA-binding NtrC family response regulator